MRSSILRACLAALLAVLAVSHDAFGVGAVLNKSGPIAVTTDGQFVWCVNPDHDSVSRIRTSDRAVTHFPLPAIGEPHKPRGLAILPGGAEVWVACQDSNRVYSLNAASGAVLAEIVLHHGSGPISVAVSPGGTQALVAMHTSAQVAVIDTVARSLVGVIDGLYPHPLGISYVSTPNRAWLTHSQLDGENSYMTEIDTAARNVAAQVIFKSTNPKFLTQIPTDPDPIPDGGYILIHSHPAQLPNSSYLWVPVQYQNFHTTDFTPNSSIQAALHKINLTTRNTEINNRLVFTAVYAHNNNSQLLGAGWNAGVAGPVDIGFNAGGTVAYMVNAYSNDVLVFATNTAQSKAGGANPLVEIAVGDNPVGIAVSPTAERAYVLNHLSRDVSEINLTTNQQIVRIAVTPGTPEPKSPEFLLGAKVFNSTTDPRISGNQKVACASCHPEGGTDGLLWDLTQLGAGQRKTLHLTGLSLAFAPQSNGRGQLHRSGDRDEVQDFDFTFFGEIMGGTGFLAAPNPALGAANAGLSPELDALATYVLSLPPLAKSPARAPDGSLSAAAVRGAMLFTAPSGPHTAGCAECHPAPNFTDLGFHDVGGTVRDGENEGPLFNTPGLVGAWDNGPYAQVTGFFSDDRSLGGVVRDARAGLHGDTSTLTDRQMRDLEVFLNSIDGDLAGSGLGGVIDTVRPRVLAVRPVSLAAVEVIFDETVDPATAGDPANYAFHDGIRVIPATAADVTESAGDRVRVSVPLKYEGCPVVYTLTPGAIEDVAGDVGSGANNALDTLDPENQRSFVLDGTITVTFGNVGDETFAGVTKDASFETGNSTFSHTHWKLYPNFTPEQKGFVAFDFVPALTQACGVAAAADILDARFSARPLFGDRNTLELRRCFLPWGDPGTDFCIACTSAVTRSHATYPSIAWHSGGAASKGGSGTTPAEYHPTSTFDVANTVDATAVVGAINERVDFSGPLITDAFRFWLNNPTKNFGYSVEVVGASALGTEFWAGESEAGRHGPVLSITFAVHAATTFADCNANGQPDDCDLRAGILSDADGDGLPDACEVPGDATGDFVVDLSDYAVFADCMDGPGATPTPTAPTTPAICLGVFDFDTDNDVDLGDFAGFQSAMTSP